MALRIDSRIALSSVSEDCSHRFFDGSVGTWFLGLGKLVYLASISVSVGIWYEQSRNGSCVLWGCAELLISLTRLIPISSIYTYTLIIYIYVLIKVIDSS